MREEGFIIPYTYHCMAMSSFANILKRELGNDWRWAQLLPKHFDACDPKGTPMFHEGIHVPCYCLPRLWPVISGRGTEDDLKRCKVILLFAKKSRNRPASLIGFIEIEKIEGPFYGMDEKSPCVKRHCPNLVAGICCKKSKASVYVIYKSVYIIDSETVKDKKSPVNTRRGWWEGARRPGNNVKECQDKLLKMYEEVRRVKDKIEVKPERWRLLIRDVASALHEHGILRCLYDKAWIRDIWRFVGILNIVENTLRAAKRST